MKIKNSNNTCLINVAIAALCGAVFGGMAMAYLAKNASQYFMEDVRFHLAKNQEHKAEQAVSNNDFSIAAHHYRNSLYYSENSSADIFEHIKKQWTLFFPIKGTLANSLYSSSISVFQDSLNKREGVSRAELAWALERVGKETEAEYQYQRAAVLLGFSDISKVKLFSKKLMHEIRKE